MEEQYCSKCGIKKFLSTGFSKRNRRGVTYYESRCKECASKNACKYNKTHKKESALRTRNSSLKKKYGITLEKYEEKLISQGGVCAICKVDKNRIKNRAINFVVDHNHNCCPGVTSCGKCLRGIVCSKCLKILNEVQDIVANIPQDLPPYLIVNISSYINSYVYYVGIKKN